MLSHFDCDSSFTVLWFVNVSSMKSLAAVTNPSNSRFVKEPPIALLETQPKQLLFEPLKVGFALAEIHTPLSVGVTFRWC